MRAYLAGLLLSLLLISPTWAADTPPTDASLNELLDVVQARNLLDNARAQADTMMQAALKKRLAERTFDDAEKKILMSSERKMKDLLAQELAWEKMQPMYMDIYRKSFSQKEVDDMLVFYRSPTGKAMVAKMPVVMQQTMQSIQTMMSTMVPAIDKISQETQDQLNAYHAGKS